MRKRVVTFECTRCGHCCKTMRGPTMGQIHGLMLLPYERELFPKKLIKPMFRYMESYMPLPGFVWMYQVDLEKCPHYDDEEGCLIYKKRPQVCRSFPFEPKGSGIAIHHSCLEIQRILKKGPTAIKFPPSYVPSLAQVQVYYNKWLRKEIERFDLGEQRWKPMTEGLTRKQKRGMGWI